MTLNRGEQHKLHLTYEEAENYGSLSWDRHMTLGDWASAYSIRNIVFCAMICFEETPMAVFYSLRRKEDWSDSLRKPLLFPHEVNSFCIAIDS